MEDKFFNIDEMMVEYAEMTSFNFNSGNYLAVSGEKDSLHEYIHQSHKFKCEFFDILDMLKSKFLKPNLQKI